METILDQSAGSTIPPAAAFVRSELVDRAPKGWAEHSLPARANLLTDPARAWNEITGVNPGESRFAICLPVHNDEGSVQLALEGVAGSLLPREGDVTVFVIANACSDRSSQKVREYLASLGTCARVKAPTELDPGLRADGTMLRLEGVTFVHFETSTRGKASAQSLATRLALRECHKLIVSVDSDTVVEPDAFARMYSAWRDNPPAGEAGHKLIFGQRTKVIPDRPISPLLKLLIQREEVSAAPLQYSGKLMAWDCEWLMSKGGMPRFQMEDYALALIAKRDGLEIKISEGRTWANACGTLPDLLQTWVRWARGIHQLKETFPDRKSGAILEELFPGVGGTFGSRFSALIKKQVDAPSITAILRFALREGLLVWGRKQMQERENPEGWEKIRSTKL